jgi:hypothetical protein
MNLVYLMGLEVGFNIKCYRKGFFKPEAACQSVIVLSGMFVVDGVGGVTYCSYTSRCSVMYSYCLFVQWRVVLLCNGYFLGNLIYVPEV